MSDHRRHSEPLTHIDLFQASLRAGLDLVSETGTRLQVGPDLMTNLRRLADAIDIHETTGADRLPQMAAQVVAAIHQLHLFEGRMRTLFIRAVLTELCGLNKMCLNLHESELRQLGTPGLGQPAARVTLIDVLSRSIIPGKDTQSFRGMSDAGVTVQLKTVMIIGGMRDLAKDDRRELEEILRIVVEFFKLNGAWDVYCPALDEQRDPRTDDEIADDHERRLREVKAVVTVIHPKSVGVGIIIGAVPARVPLLVLGPASMNKPRLIRDRRYRTYINAEHVEAHLMTFVAETAAGTVGVTDRLVQFIQARRSMYISVRAARADGSYVTPAGMTDSRVDDIVGSTEGYASAQLWELAALSAALELPEIGWPGTVQAVQGTGFRPPRRETDETPAGIAGGARPAWAVGEDPLQLAFDLGMDVDALLPHEDLRVEQMEQALETLQWKDSEWLSETELRSHTMASERWTREDTEWMLRWARATRAYETLVMGRSDNLVSGRLRQIDLESPLDWNRALRRQRAQRGGRS